ncbi:MAG TPA: response regulator [Burkholderiales bacterium]|nr:response regulator [Burkholderiales bacterium]
MRVLVVDDNADVLLSINALLEGAGYESETASDARRAIEIHRRRPADVVITDIFMPDQDGLETIVKFRTEWPGVKIVAMSGGGDIAKQDYLQVAQHAGADAMLRKPFEPEELLRTVNRLTRGADG